MSGTAGIRLNSELLFCCSVNSRLIRCTFHGYGSYVSKILTCVSLRPRCLAAYNNQLCSKANQVLHLDLLISSLDETPSRILDLFVGHRPVCNQPTKPCPVTNDES